MLPVANRPMIERVLAHLAGHGVDEAVLALGYRPDAFVDAYPGGTCAGVRLRYAVEPEPRDTAGAIRFAADHAGIRERFLVVNGDVLTDLDVGELVRFHDGAGAEATLALHRVADPSAFGVVATGPGGQVAAFVEKPEPGTAPSDLVNAGTYVFEPAALARIPAGIPVNVERVTFPAMAADGALFARDGQAYWIDAGTPATYLQANLDRVAGRGGPPCAGVDGTAEVAGTLDEAVVGPGATVGAGARVVRSVLLDGATVGAGAQVEGSVVGVGAQVGEGARVVGSVLGDGVAVPGDAVLSGARVPEPVP